VNYVRTVHAAELNADGMMDVISIDEEVNQIFWCPHEEGDFTFRRSVAPAFPLAYLQENALFDEDMDSDFDLIFYR